MDIDEKQWEDNACDWCASTEYVVVFDGPDRLERLPGQFRMVYCKNCGLFRQNPRLKWESLKNYYPEDYVAYEYLFQEENQKTLRNCIKNYGNWKRRRAIEQFQESGRLLEVGCGTGSFLKEALRTNNWEVVGIEPSEPAASHAHESLGVPIYQGLFSEINLESQSFDVIVMFCVLEHLGEPVQDMRRAHKLLKNGGYLIFTIPNYNSLGAKIFGKYWAGWDLPRHLYIFPQSTLQEILNDIGFEIADERCLATSYHSLGHSLEFWSQVWEDKFPRLKKWTMRIYTSWFVQLGLALPLAVLDYFKLCTNITIFAQKVASHENV